MAISQGTRLGPYEVLSPAGSGGMGEVYKARDTRLDRTVAVKVLPQHLSASAEARQRFEREAKTISQLSHPHICALYDVGNQDGVEYLVMEYLEGETLAERLLKGSLPVDQTLRYGIEIADALDKAHRQGIIHRDLKPGNVMLTKSGVKLLDFGLAKAVQPVSGMNELTSLPTQGPALTAEGTILGTFQYMAPEQLEGRDSDARTDIFSLGAVLYEMATGRKAFSGRSRASLIGAILKDEPPPVSTVEKTTPPALDRVIKTCLAKDPEDRWQTARDLGLELKWVAEGGSASAAAAPRIPRRAGREKIAWALAALLAVALAATLARSALRRAPESGPRGPIKLSVLPPEKTLFVPGMISLSRDGTRLAFVAAGADGKPRIWIRSLDSLESRPLSGSEGAYAPFWSWDGRYLAFFADGKLKKMEVSGGPPQTLLNLPATFGRGGSWNREGVILFSPGPTTGLFRISDAGGPVTAVTELDGQRQENSHRWPVFLPDGRRFLYLGRSRQKENRAVFVGSLDSKEKRLLMNGSSNALFAPDEPGSSEGYLLFEREGWLVARRLGLPGLRFLGDPIPVADGIQPSDPLTAAMFSASETGVLAYGRGSSGTLTKLTWFDREGKRLGGLDSPGHCLDVSLSPDGKRAVLDIVDSEVGGRQLWVIDLARNVAARLSLGDRNEFSPIWSPDGESLIFASNDVPASMGGTVNLYRKPSSGAGEGKLLLRSDARKLPDDWSSDGRHVLFDSTEGGETSGASTDRSKTRLWVLPLPSGDPAPLRPTPYAESLGAFSPDGRWIAYVSDESGRAEVYVQTFPVSSAKWRVSTDGGTEPRWRGDGREIFYIAPANRLMSVSVKPGPLFEAGTPSTLLEVGTAAPFGVVGQRHHYAVSRDGTRFLVVGAETQGTQPMTLILNWASSLKK